MTLKSISLTRAELLTQAQKDQLGVQADTGLVIIETRNPNLRVVGQTAMNYVEYMRSLGEYIPDPTWDQNGGRQ